MACIRYADFDGPEAVLASAGAVECALGHMVLSISRHGISVAFPGARLRVWKGLADRSHE